MSLSDFVAVRQQGLGQTVDTLARNWFARPEDKLDASLTPEQLEFWYCGVKKGQDVPLHVEHLRHPGYCQLSHLRDLKVQGLNGTYQQGMAAPLAALDQACAALVTVCEVMYVQICL